MAVLLSPIRPGELLPLETAKAGMGWGRAAYRTAVSKGLKVKSVGKRKYILFDDLIRFVAETGDDQSGNE